MKMCDTSSDIESIDETLSDIRDATVNDTNHPLQGKTRKVYDRIYQDFINWKTLNNKHSFKEKVILEYFVELSEKYKSSTLSTSFSILKNTLSQNHNVDITKYHKVIALLKRKAQGYTGRKSKTFSPEDINTFLREADDDKYLCAKVALIFGIVGGCRRQELYRQQFKDVDVLPSKILVKVENTKTKVDRLFTLTGDYYVLCKKYISLRPNPCSCPTFFIQYKSGKCFPQTIGINHFGTLGKTIAKFLGLNNPELYTGHCFKRTAATILVDTDGDILPFPGHIRYKSVQVTETGSGINNSIESSLENKSNENINKTSTTVLEDCSNNTIESIIKELNCPNLENENIGYINVDVPIPNKSENIDASLSLDSKDEVWDQLKISFAKGSNNVVHTTPGTSVLEDYLDDSMDSEDQARNQNQNPLEDNTDKVVNINIPSTSNNFEQAFSTLVCFNNCSIENVNVNNNYNK